MAWSSKNRKKQTRLQFQSLPTMSSVKDTYSSAVQDRLANVRYSGATRPQITPKKDHVSNLPTPEPSSISKKQFSSPENSLPSSPDLHLQRTPEPKNDENDVGDDDDDEILLPSSKRRKLSRRIANTTLASSPRRSMRLAASSPLQRLHRSRVKEPHTDALIPRRTWSDVGSPETSGDEADEVDTRPLRRRAGEQQRDDPFVVNNDQINFVSSEDDDPTEVRRKAPKKVVDDFMVDDDVVEYITSDDEPQPVSSKKPSSRRATKRSDKEQLELEEDLLDLQDSGSDGEIRQSRTRGGPVTTQRDELRAHLARLKKKRAKKSVARIVISDEEEDEEADTEPEEHAIDINYISQRHPQTEKSSEESRTQSLIGAPELHPETFDNDEDEEEDDGFIIKDTEASTSSRRSRPHPDIPLQFTSFASAKPKELFIHIIEWLVKNKISPAFSRDDDLYSLSFNRVDDQVKAQAGSRLISAAWSANFKYSILARPIMTVEALPGLDEDHVRTCDACNRTNHPARYDFKFTGMPYNKDTLEPLEADDEKDPDRNSNQDGEESDSHSEQDEITSQRSNCSYDSQGHLLPRQSTHFYLGRYCAAAAEMGHKLTHWKNHLNTEVLSYLSDQGVISAEEIVRRDRQSHKKREKEAENIVDSMQETGVIRELWQRFQADLDDARWGMEGHEARHGKGRGKQRIGSVRVGGADGRIGEWMEGGRYKETLRVDSDSDV